MKFVFFGEEKKFENGKKKEGEGCQNPKNHGELLFRKQKREDKRQKERDGGRNPSQVGKGLQRIFPIGEGNFESGDHSFVGKPAPIKKGKEKHYQGEEQGKGHQERKGLFQMIASFGKSFFYYRHLLRESQDFGIVCQWYGKVEFSKKRRKQS
jgi:hypothetical protein